MKLKKILGSLIVGIMMFNNISINTLANETKHLTLNDSSDTNSYLPSYQGEMNCPQHNQFILSKDKLTSIKGAKISKMTFYVASGESTDANYSVSLMETDETSFTTDLIDSTSATAVYNGTFNISNNKVEISFSSNYEYSGKNLLIDVQLSIAPTTNLETSFYGHNVSSNVAITQVGLDSIQTQTFLPKITFDYTIDEYLDLEDSNTYSNTKDISQNYTFTQNGDTTYTDVTKVKLSWNISDIEATYTSNKTWDPDTLTWKETKAVSEIANKTAEFTLTNYSSIKVVGNISFEAESSLENTLKSATFDDNNGATIESVVNSDYSIDETKKNNVPSNKITATLEFNKDKFADLSEASSKAKYGTYTIKLLYTQKAPEAPTVSSTSADSVILNEITTLGYGDIEYAMSLTTTAPKDGWQSSTTFSTPELSFGTKYYFFARYKGDDTHAASDASNYLEVSIPTGE